MKFLGSSVIPSYELLVNLEQHAARPQASRPHGVSLALARQSIVLSYAYKTRSTPFVQVTVALVNLAPIFPCGPSHLPECASLHYWALSQCLPLSQAEELELLTNVMPGPRLISAPT